MEEVEGGVRERERGGGGDGEGKREGEKRRGRAAERVKAWKRSGK